MNKTYIPLKGYRPQGKIFSPMKSIRRHLPSRIPRRSQEMPHPGLLALAISHGSQAVKQSTRSPASPRNRPVGGTFPSCQPPRVRK